jgi:16S rRNA (guanine527-N7)-methyltransferase
MTNPTSPPPAPHDPAALLAATLADWGWPLAPVQLDQFAQYAAELQRWNQYTNLTSITDTSQIYLRHFLDSLVCARSWGEPPHRLIDLGSGAGFPGLPLKLLHPALHLTLVESVGKKTAFLQHIVTQLGLHDVSILTARAEAVGRDPQQRAAYDVVTVRAVAELRVLAEYGLPLLRQGGRLLAPKGAAVDDEIAAAQHALGLLGGRLLAAEPVQLPQLPPRTLLVLEKIADTPARYPRAVGVPARRPL